MPRTALGADGVLARPFEVADRLGGGIKDINRRRISRSQILSKLLGVAPIGLDPRPGCTGTSDGAMTSQAIPAASSRRLKPKPVGPAS